MLNKEGGIESINNFLVVSRWQGVRIWPQATDIMFDHIFHALRGGQLKYCGYSDVGKREDRELGNMAAF